jgi:hypothetical protein
MLPNISLVEKRIVVELQCQLLPFGSAHSTGLPNFSWNNIPKRGKIYQMTTKLPNAHNVYQMGQESQVLQNTPKFGFWYVKKPSGNPAVQYKFGTMVKCRLTK